MLIFLFFMVSKSLGHQPVLKNIGSNSPCVLGDTGRRQSLKNSCTAELRNTAKLDNILILLNKKKKK